MTKQAAPEPLVLGDGEAILFDPAEVVREYDAIAVMLQGGVLFVLQRGTHKWVNVESTNHKPAGKLSAIRGGS